MLRLSVDRLEMTPQSQAVLRFEVNGSPQLTGSSLPVYITITDDRGRLEETVLVKLRFQP